MKYGIIGTGWIAESFIEGVRLVTGSEISAVYSRTKEKGKAFADKNNIATVYTDLEEFANGDFDAVYVASPNALHYGQSKLCLENGKHVLCEKPITVCEKEYTLLREFAEEKGLIYLEAIMYMHSPVRNQLRLYRDKCGLIRTAHFDFSQLSSKYPALTKGELPNIFNPELKTGAFMDLGIYCIYPVIDLFGYPDKTIGENSLLFTGADAAGSVTMKFPASLITITYSKVGQDYLGSQIIGDKGTVTIGSISKLTNVVFHPVDGEDVVICEDTPKAVLMGNEAKDFEDYIAGNNLAKYRMECETASLVCRLMDEVKEKINR